MCRTWLSVGDGGELGALPTRRCQWWMPNCEWVGVPPSPWPCGLMERQQQQHDSVNTGFCCGILTDFRQRSVAQYSGQCGGQSVCVDKGSVCLIQNGYKCVVWGVYKYVLVFCVCVYVAVCAMVLYRLHVEHRKRLLQIVFPSFTVEHYALKASVTSITRTLILFWAVVVQGRHKWSVYDNRVHQCEQCKQVPKNIVYARDSDSTRPHSLHLSSLVSHLM